MKDAGRGAVLGSLRRPRGGDARRAAGPRRWWSRPSPTPGYDTELQAIPAVGGANVLARLPGTSDRWVLVAAHYDHVGAGRGRRSTAAPTTTRRRSRSWSRSRARSEGDAPPARGVIFAAFDAEEPPNFLSSTMGSQHFVEHPPVPLDSIDMMVCMDLVGHAVGPPGMPAEIRQTVFALGAERSAGTAAHVDALARAVPGVVIRRVDAEAIPPLSDYYAFWQRSIPFLFLSNGRSRIYHTPEDTPEKLDFAKMQRDRGVARALRARDVRAAGGAHRVAPRRPRRRLDAADAGGRRARDGDDPTRRGAARAAAEALLAACAAEGRLPGPLPRRAGPAHRDDGGGAGLASFSACPRSSSPRRRGSARRSRWGRRSRGWWSRSRGPTPATSMPDRSVRGIGTNSDATPRIRITRPTANSAFMDVRPASSRGTRTRAR